MKHGDRVIIYMPMVPEAVIAMLACARIGAVHSVVFGGFAAPELAKRIDDATPVLIVSRVLRHRAGPHRSNTSRCSMRPLQLATHQVARCIVLQRPQCAGRDESWRAISTGTTR